jgi:hypothetical protein
MTAAVRPRLRTGRHLLRRADLAGAAVPLARGGVVIGRVAGIGSGPGSGGAAAGGAVGSNTGNPLALNVFGDRPRALAAVLDQQIAAVLALRALAVGARLRIVTSRADRWLPLRRFGVDDTEVVSVSSPQAQDLPASDPDPDRPTLVLIDQTSTAADLPRVEPRPWQCTLTLLPDLSLRSLPIARSTGLVLMRRLNRSEAVAAGPFLGLPPGGGQRLATLADEQIAVVERGLLLVADLALTGTESQLVVAATGSALKDATFKDAAFKDAAFKDSAAPASDLGVQAEDRPDQRQ